MTDQADLILSASVVHTMNPAAPRAEAVAISQGRILAVGTAAELERFATGSTVRVELSGATILPGLMDSHCHLSFVGGYSDAAQLYDVRSIDELVERLRAHAERFPGRIMGVGGNFHPAALAEGRLPNAADLDRVSTDRPVMITDVNKSIVNSLVLNTVDMAHIPPGGEVPLDASGRPLGIFLYAAKAMTPLGGQGDQVVSAISPEEMILHGARLAARFGLTGVMESWLEMETLQAYRQVAKDGRLGIRVTLMPTDASPLDTPPAAMAKLGLAFGRPEGLVTFGAVKLFFDYFLMHRTALMYSPLKGAQGLGQTAISEDDLRRKVAGAFAAGWPVGVHCTGDRGADIVAGVLAKEIESRGSAPARCHMIHAYFPSQSVLDIACRHGIALAMQPGFTHVWGDTVSEFLDPARAMRFNPLRTILDRQLTVGGGSDAPITTLNPFVGIYAAVTRKTQGGRVLGAAERISAEEALRCYTLGSAAVLGAQDERGSIEPGKLADFTVVDRDILACQTEQIPNTKVLMTIVGGKTVWKAG